MKVTRSTSCGADHPRSGTAGFTLVEAVMSMLIVGIMLVAALNTVGASKLTQRKNYERSIGPMLAEDLLTEILSQSYEEPVDTPIFGRETGEFSWSRTPYDDVDDYDGWTTSPPEDKDNADLPDLTGWARSVEVYYVDYGLSNELNYDAGLKRIHVTVTYNGLVVSELSAIRTNGWPEP
jgi:type II secretory pathway pseudopilin PulG